MTTQLLDATFAALADPTRRAILARLVTGEATVTELAAPFDMSQPAVSKHLKVLERAGLVSRSRDAQRRPVRLEARPLKEATDWLENYRSHWEEAYQQLDDLLDEPQGGQAAGGRRMTKPEPVRVSTPNATEIAMVRDFDAPRQLVFAAWTTPDLIQRWYGARGWNIVGCEIDLRVDGAWRFVWRGPDGAEMGAGGVYHEIVVPERLVYTESFDDHWYPGESLVIHVFTEQAGRTTLTTTLSFPNTEVRDAVLRSPMDRGVSEGYERLDEVLTQLRKAHDELDS